MTDMTKLEADAGYAESMDKTIRDHADEDGTPVVVDGATGRLLNLWKAEVRKVRRENGELHQEVVKLKRQIDRLEFVDDKRRRLITASSHVIRTQRIIIDQARTMGKSQAEYEIAMEEWHEAKNARLLPKEED